MDLQYLFRMSVEVFIQLILFIPTIIAYEIGFSNIIVWLAYTSYIVAIIIIIKQWNKSRPEPPLDVNLTNLELSISVILAFLVCIFGGALLQLDLQSPALSIYIVYIITLSLSTLLKSSQPDAASPTHGFNRIVSLSKPTYFTIFSSIVLACQAYVNSPISNSAQRPKFVLYNFDFFNKQVVSIIGTTSLYLIFLFPVIFILGLLPQITTFIIYFLEHIDIHLFGGTATTLGLKSAFYSFNRSLISVSILYAIVLPSIDNHQQFSLFCGILVSLSYFLSRNSSDVTSAIRVTKKIIKSLYPVKRRVVGPEKIELETIVTAPTIIVTESTPANPNNEPETNDETSDEQAPDSILIEQDTNSQTPALLQQAPASTETNSDIININPILNDASTIDKDDVVSTLSISTRIQANNDSILIGRIKKDSVKCICIIVIVFALHVTTVFRVYYGFIETFFGILAVLWGFLFHFIIPHLRRDLPFLCFRKPILKPREYNFYEVKTHAKILWFEKMYYWAVAFEKYFIYPIFWLNIITHDCKPINDMYGSRLGPLLLVIMGLKLIRQSFNDPSQYYSMIVFTYLFFEYDIASLNFKIYLINYFVFSILSLKVEELLLKLQFVYIYLAPWQIPWGSAFHAVAQPFSVPHSGLLFFQAVLSSILSAPLQPVLGSAIFMMSYVRPVKFWERDYNTNVIDINSTRLVNQLERNRIDSNRLDSIFYEHLTKCLQKKLCKDLCLGRWGPVSQGDCFIMASDNLNCLVHIVEFGNGVCTFQLRGLEFRGTYCQQQEVEAITEGVPPNSGFCCCEPGHLPHILSINASFNQHWLAWHVTHARYVLEGYSISDYPAAPMLQPFDLRRALVTYYVKSIIYFTVTSEHLSKWLACVEFHEALEHTKDKTYADLDPTFSLSLDSDFDARLCGVTRSKFCCVYYDWIEYCLERVKKDKTNPNRAKLVENFTCQPQSFLVTLCFCLSLLARRSLSAAANGQQFHTVESLLTGLFALLKGDFRVTSLHDEWIFQEMKFFKLVVIPSVRMAMKLHQDHFAAPEDYEDNMMLYEAIAGYQKNLVISHETDVAWRDAVLSGVPSLLTLRLYTDDGSNQYKFIMLNKRYLSFRVIRINRECVRGLWASQQQELIYFRNTDPERGSIQNAKQVLRNIINSSCDLPVGYPIYVSPLTTSYLESAALSSLV